MTKLGRRKTTKPNPIESLAQELALAQRLDRPLLLFVVTATDALQAQAAAALAEKLRTLGIAVVNLDVPTLNEYDVPRALSEQDTRANTVFMVNNLGRGGEPALRALNIRREYFTELKARVVFWLTPQDEKALARQATDFWSFRDWTMYLE